MRKLFLVISVLVVLSLSGCAAVPGAVSAVANLSRSVAPAAQAQATAVAPSTQGSDQSGSTNSQPAAPLAQNVPAGIAEIQNVLSNLYSTVSPSVVNINVMMNATPGQSALPDVPNMPNIPGSPFGDQGNQGGFQSAALGSGFVWDNQGHIVTNNHVVDGATRISVTFSDGLTLPAELVGRDPESEVAVIKIDPTKVSNLRPVTLGDSTLVKPGQFVVAIGNPFGLEGTMTFGIVSALGRSLPVGGAFSTAGSYTIPDIIQTDAPVNPGNSGGVLVDMTGRVVGIPTAIESQSGSSAGIGFAVPSVIVQKVVPALISTGTFEHPYIGIRGGSLTSQVAEAMGLSATTRGALVVDVTPGSPAEKAGLKGSTKTTQIDGLDAQIGGDVITAINGQQVRDFEDLTTYLARTAKVGDQVNLTILRNGNVQSVIATLAARPAQSGTAQAPQLGQGQGQGQATPNAPQTQPAPRAGSVYLGVTGMTLTPDVAQAMNLNNNAQGVLVVNVVPGSPAEQAGLKGSNQPVNLNGQQMMVGGDVITAVDGKAISTVEELVAAVQAKNAGDTMTLTINRNGQEQTVTATLATRGASGQGGQTAPATPEQGQGQATPNAPQTQPAPRAGSVYLGVTGMTLTPDIAQAMNLNNNAQGALVVNVVPGSPAEQAGLKGSNQPVNLNGQQMMVGGDVITAVDGKAISTVEELVAAVQAKNAGDTMTLTINRNGQEQTVTATLAARGASGQGGQTAPATPETQATPQAQATPQTQAPATQAAPGTQATPGTGSSSGAATPAAGGPWLGVNGVTVSAQIAQMMGLGDQRGVLLMNVVPGSPAEKAGLKGVGLGQGQFVNADIIVAVDGKNITTMDELVSAIQGKQVGDTITLTVLRNGQQQDVKVTLGARPAQ